MTYEAYDVWEMETGKIWDVLRDAKELASGMLLIVSMMSKPLTSTHKGEMMSAQKTPEAYAQRRANETGSAYLVTNMGHALWACPFNKRLAVNDLGGIASIFRKEAK